MFSDDKSFFPQPIAADDPTWYEFDSCVGRIHD
jgi:hypothetical protein